MKKDSGFTLIELLIALAIIGILASVAYPAYTGYVQDSRRATAKATISAIANDLERYYSRNNTYVGWTLNAAAYRVDKYALAVPTATLTASSYTITATPQASDKCGTLTMTESGQGTASTGAAGCW